MPEKKPPRILVVDDQVTQTVLISGILQRNGYDFATARSGTETLEILIKKKENFDLILLDSDMPEIDGYQTCKKIQTTPRTQSIPVIMLCDQSNEESTLKAFRVGAVDCIPKPLNDKELVAQIRSLLRYLKMLSMHSVDHRKLIKLANEDPITHTANRVRFTQTLERYLKNKEVTALHVIYITLGGLKAANQRFGFSNVDKFLAKFCDMLSKLFDKLLTKETEFLIGRIHGVEFGIILSGMSQEQLLKTKSLLRRHTDSLNIGGERVRAYIGVATARDSEEVSILINRSRQDSISERLKSD